MKKHLLAFILILTLTLPMCLVNASADGLGSIEFETNLIADGNLIPVDTNMPNEITLFSVHQSLYDVILDGMTNMDATIPVSSFRMYLNNQTQVNNMIETYSTVINENPAIFYMDDGFSVNYNIYTNLITEIVPKYIPNAEESKVIFKEKTMEILNKCIRKGMTDEDKALALHDYIVSEGEYNTGTNVRHDFTAYGIIVDKIGVCQSYSLAYNYLLSLVGIESKLCISDGVYDENNNLISGMDHGWSYVKLNDKWYHVDTTWDDPNLSADMMAMKFSMHNYFLLSDETIGDPVTGKHYDWIHTVDCTDKTYETEYPFVRNENKSVPVTSTSYYSAYLPYFPYKYNTEDNLFYSKLYVPGNAVYYKTDFSGSKFEYITKDQYDKVTTLPAGISSYVPMSLENDIATPADVNHLDNLYVTLTNNSGADISGKLIISYYGTENRLITCKTMMVTVPANDSETVNISQSVGEKVDHSKIFMWNSNSTPLMLSPVTIQ